MKVPPSDSRVNNDCEDYVMKCDEPRFPPLHEFDWDGDEMDCNDGSVLEKRPLCEVVKNHKIITSVDDTVQSKKSTFPTLNSTATNSSANPSDDDEVPHMKQPVLDHLEPVTNGCRSPLASENGLTEKSGCASPALSLSSEEFRLVYFSEGEEENKNGENGVKQGVSDSADQENTDIAASSVEPMEVDDSVCATLQVVGDDTKPKSPHEQAAIKKAMLGLGAEEDSSDLRQLDKERPPIDEVKPGVTDSKTVENTLDRGECKSDVETKPTTVPETNINLSECETTDSQCAKLELGILQSNKKKLDLEVETESIILDAEPLGDSNEDQSELLDEAELLISDNEEEIHSRPGSVENKEKCISASEQDNNNKEFDNALQSVKPLEKNTNDDKLSCELENPKVNTLSNEKCDSASSDSQLGADIGTISTNEETAFLDDSIDISSPSDHGNESVQNIIKNLETDNEDSEGSFDRGHTAGTLLPVDKVESDKLLEIQPETPLLPSNGEKVTSSTAASLTKIHTDNVESKALESNVINTKNESEIKLPDCQMKNTLKDETLLGETNCRHDSTSSEVCFSTSVQKSGKSHCLEKKYDKPIPMDINDSKTQIASSVKDCKVVTSAGSLVDSQQALADGLTTKKANGGSSKRSLDDTEGRESLNKKIKLNGILESSPFAGSSEPNPTGTTTNSSQRIRIKSLEKESTNDEDKSVKETEIFNNGIQSFVTQNDKNILKNVKIMSRKELEGLVLRQTMDAITLRCETAVRAQELRVMQDKVAEYKKKMQPLNKQVSDLSNVIVRLEQALQKNPKPARPLKVTRSVGLQVNFTGSSNMTPKMSANAGPVRPGGVKTLRPVHRPAATPPQVQPPEKAKTLRVSLPNSSVHATSPGTPSKNMPGMAHNRTNSSPVVTRVSPAIQHPSPAMHTISPMLTSALQSPSQNTAVVASRSNNNHVPDLMDTEDRPGAQATQHYNLMQMQTGGRISLIPPQGITKQGVAPVAYLLQSPQSRPVLLTPSGQPAGRGINLNTLQWVQNMQTGAGGNHSGKMLQRPLGTTTNIRQSQVTVRPATQGVPLQRGSLYTVGPAVAAFQRAPLTVPATATPATYVSNKVQHPAPLPAVPTHPPPRPNWKLPPPKPALRITKVHQGIVLSWNMTETGDFEDMKSYQIYAYQESKDPPSSSLWKTVGDVKALALPMACTLTQFKEGHKYHFSVRAVDIHSRMGPHSDPTSIVLFRS